MTSKTFRSHPPLLCRSSFLVPLLYLIISSISFILYLSLSSSFVLPFSLSFEFSPCSLLSYPCFLLISRYYFLVILSCSLFFPLFCFYYPVNLASSLLLFFFFALVFRLLFHSFSEVLCLLLFALFRLFLLLSSLSWLMVHSCYY